MKTSQFLSLPGWQLVLFSWLYRRFNYTRTEQSSFLEGETVMVPSGVISNGVKYGNVSDELQFYTDLKETLLEWSSFLPSKGWEQILVRFLFQRINKRINQLKSLSLLGVTLFVQVKTTQKGG